MLKNQQAQRIFLKQSCNELWFVKKWGNHTFKVNFLCQKSTEFFSNFNFWTTLFSKIMPNFWQTDTPRILKIQWYLLSAKEKGVRSNQIFLLTAFFEALYFLKSCPISDKLALPVFSKYNGFHWVYWFLAKDLAF